MRVVHVPDLPALARIATPDDLIVAVPSQLSALQVLDLASLILTPDEYAALASQVAIDTAEYANL
jgi:hypothetical protein